MLAVVKANAYGHGLMRVLPALDGADGLALIELEAALALRAAALFTSDPAARRILRRRRARTDFATHGLHIVVHDEEQVRMLETARLPARIDVFVKANTGMNRLGFAPADVPGVCARLEALKAGASYG